MIVRSQRRFHGPTFRRFWLRRGPDLENSGDYKPGNVPTSAQQLIPFMVMIAARTGINTFSLYGLERDCLRPHELDDNLFYCVWDKPRAGKQQKQLHRRSAEPDGRSGTDSVPASVHRTPGAGGGSGGTHKILPLFRQKPSDQKQARLAEYAPERGSRAQLQRVRRPSRLAQFTLASIRPRRRRSYIWKQGEISARSSSSSSTRAFRRR